MTFCFLSFMLFGVVAEAITAEEVIEKARAYLGEEAVLSGVQSVVFKAHMVDPPQ